MQICALISDGLTANDIAKHLNISSRTVKNHVENIKIKLGPGHTIRHVIRFYLNTILNPNKSSANLKQIEPTNK